MSGPAEVLLVGKGTTVNPPTRPPTQRVYSRVACLSGCFFNLIGWTETTFPQPMLLAGLRSRTGCVQQGMVLDECATIEINVLQSLILHIYTCLFQFFVGCSLDSICRSDSYPNAHSLSYIHAMTPNIMLIVHTYRVLYPLSAECCPRERKLVAFPYLMVTGLGPRQWTNTGFAF